MSKEGIIGKARTLRKENTTTEKILWKELRGNKLGMRWRRQHPIDMYILDFYCADAKLCGIRYINRNFAHRHTIHNNKTLPLRQDLRGKAYGVILTPQ